MCAVPTTPTHALIVFVAIVGVTGLVAGLIFWMLSRDNDASDTLE